MLTVVYFLYRTGKRNLLCHSIELRLEHLWTLNTLAWRLLGGQTSVRDVVPDHEGDLASGQPSLVTALVVDVPNERNPS